MKVAIFSDFDSRIKWGLSVCSNMLSAEVLSSAIVDLYFISFDQTCLNYYNVPLNNVVKYRKKEELICEANFYDVIVLALGGSDNLSFLSAVNLLKRPIIISGFNGLTDGYDIHGLLCRYGSDIICVNSCNDMVFFDRALSDLNLSKDSLTLTGFQRSYLNSYKGIKNIATKNMEREILLFVEQIGIPDTLARLEYLVLGLEEMALLNPDKDVFIKSRKKKGFLNVNYKESARDFNDVWNYKIKEKPANIYFVDEEIEEILPHVSLCFSFTSTVILEALSLGINVAVLSDFGISKKIGNHVFVGSDLFESIGELSRGARPRVNNCWLKNNLSINLSNTLQIKLAKVMGKDRCDIQIYYTKDKFPFYYFKQNKKNIKTTFKRYFFYKIQQIKGMFR